MIRAASLNDMSAIIPMAVKFNDEYFAIPLNLEKAAYVITMAIEEGEAFISECGFIGALYVEDLMRDWSILQEVAWYATDNSGMKLLDELIVAWRTSGVDELRLSTLATSPPVVGKLLQRKGFAPLEMSYRLTGAGPWPLSRPSLPSQP